MSFSLPDIERETIEDLIVSIHESLDEIEPSLGLLVADPDRKDLVNDLFRNLHTIKGNFRMCFLEPFTDYVHEIEEAISEVRNGHLRFSPALKEAVLIGLDKLRINMDILQAEGELDTRDMETYGDYFQRLAEGAAADSAEEKPPAIDNSMKEELLYFRDSALKFDRRVVGRQGRTEQMLKVVSLIFSHSNANTFSEHVMIDRWQMQAAIYMHDIGHNLNKDLIEHLQVDNEHAEVAYNYLKKFPCWQQAAEIVYQHHELLDGSGYPRQLSADAIHPGAQLLGVVARFVDLVAMHKEISERLAVVAAIKTLNSEAGIFYNAELISLLPDIALAFCSQGDMAAA
ncbi:HD domain-containing phosphohydrolase [Oceanicoccus sagamiensis]|uniref:HPt domain-containing protein n=1 Tax=Oceanicoccus sagamiensis TaxID=716816 RepID=A0A1X9N8V3_9GAMM|nr:HD domain-containing phosphohydrolase [Oceanicoccus sagamiensis]ARN73514.1 hypothetical protein BST96_04905 [Oceanicoccus sagamiensis]